MGCILACMPSHTVSPDINLTPTTPKTEAQWLECTFLSCSSVLHINDYINVCDGTSLLCNNTHTTLYYQKHRKRPFVAHAAELH